MGGGRDFGNGSTPPTGRNSLDPRYEFDAPKLRYDLAQATELDLSADQWFDCNVSSSRHEPLEEPTPEEIINIQAELNQTCAIDSSFSHTVTTAELEQAEMEFQGTPMKPQIELEEDLVKSFSKMQGPICSTPASHFDHSHVLESGQKSVFHTPMAALPRSRMPTMTPKRPFSVANNTPLRVPVESHTIGNTGVKSGLISAENESDSDADNENVQHSPGLYSDDPHRTVPLVTGPVHMSTARPQLTVPVTPSWAKRSVRILPKHSVLTADEQLEKERMEAMAQQHNRRIEAEMRMHKVKQAPAMAPTTTVRKAIPLTAPKTPKFRTDKRIGKARLAATTSTDTNPIATAAVAEKKPIAPAKRAIEKPALTVPKSPKFTQTVTRSRTDKNEVEKDSQLCSLPSAPKAVPHIEKREVTRPALTVPKSPKFSQLPLRNHHTDQAEKLSQHHIKATVQTLPRNKKPVLTDAVSKPRKTLALTVPVTPKFHTTSRHRPVTVLSKEEEEKLAMQNMPQFKAAKPDPKILYSRGDLGVPRVPKKPLTQPIEPVFHVDERIGRQKDTHVTTTEVHGFHARPAPNDIFRKVIGVPDRKPKPPTIPISPAFHTITVRSTTAHRPETEPDENTVAPSAGVVRPVPDFTKFKPFQPKHDHKTTMPQPFPGLEANTKRYAEQLLDKRRRLEEEEQRLQMQHQFKAQPILYPELAQESMAGHTNGHHWRPTQPKPFQLMTDLRGEMTAKKIEDQQREEEERLRKLREFKANDAYKKALRTPPAVDRPVIPLTEVHDVQFNSDIRLMERAAKQKERTEREKMAEPARREVEAEALRREKEEMRKFRAQLVPRAKPVPVTIFRGFQVRPSEQDLTEPETPEFAKPKHHTAAAATATQQ